MRPLLRPIVAGLAIGLLFPAPVRPQDTATVVEIVDGDTLLVQGRDETLTVRLIGIDAPERSHPSRSKEFLSDEAAAFLASLCDGKTIGLEPGDEDADRLGRLLRYVRLPDGRLANLEMIREGYAHVMRAFPFSRSAEFLRAEQEARREGKGLWKAGGLAELRWLQGGGGAPLQVWPAAGRKHIVVYQGFAKPGIERQELGRTIEQIARLRAELSDAEFEEKARQAGFHPLQPANPAADGHRARPPETAPPRLLDPSEVISWEEAHRYVGQEVTVEGRIVRVHRGKNVLYLNFHSNWKKYVTVVILGKDLGRFPKDTEKRYKGKVVRVQGAVALYRDRPEIVIRSPEAITLVE